MTVPTRSDDRWRTFPMLRAIEAGISGNKLTAFEFSEFPVPE